MLQNYKEIFQDFSLSSRVWVYASNRALNSTESTYAQDEINEFVKQWATHGKELVAKGAVLFDRFIILTVDEQKVGASGCSIDSSVHFVKALGKELNVNFFDRLNLYIINDQEIKQIHISEMVNFADWNLFDPMIANLEQLINSWIVPVNESVLFPQEQG
jgi:predicted lactoylglutathione lyase